MQNYFLCPHLASCILYLTLYPRVGPPSHSLSTWFCWTCQVSALYVWQRWHISFAILCDFGSFLHVELLCDYDNAGNSRRNCTEHVTKMGAKWTHLDVWKDRLFLERSLFCRLVVRNVFSSLSFLQCFVIWRTFSIIFRVRHYHIDWHEKCFLVSPCVLVCVKYFCFPSALAVLRLVMFWCVAALSCCFLSVSWMYNDTFIFSWQSQCFCPDMIVVRSPKNTQFS